MATSVTVGPNRLGAAVESICHGYTAAVVDALNEESKDAMNLLVRTTKATAPTGRRRRHYKSTIYGKLYKSGATGDTYVWHAREYQLSHLLESDHATGGYLNHGHARGSHFISRAWAKVEPEYVARVKEAVRRAS